MICVGGQKLTMVGNMIFWMMIKEGIITLPKDPQCFLGELAIVIILFLMTFVSYMIKN